ncbi:ligand-binding sensor domain-containing protein [Niabella hirudinis]|uniref:ligand-binding sensor domain-containing protein n=1 Tax=Niabella hirudinis TaxID=1285929 RepID=UPI003EBD009B
MYNTVKLSILICLLLGNYSYLQAQNYLQPNAVQGEPLGVRQGLSQGMINCVYQDKEGFMWICTKDGLNRYDGYNIITYRNIANDAYSLPDNYCNAIAEDENGNFWVGTNTKGLFVFNKQTESFYPVQVINNKKGNLCIREIKYANGKLFLKTWTDALILDISTVKLKNSARISAKIIFSYNQCQPNKKYRIDNNVNALYGLSIMPNYSIWVSFADSIFNLIPNTDFSKWSVIGFTPALLGIEENGKEQISFFPVPDKPANMVITYKNQIIHFNENTHKVLSKKALPVANPASFNKYFWLNDSSICSFTDSLVYIYQPQSGSIVVSERNKSLPKGAIVSFFTDASGIQWHGSSGFGIVKIDPRKKRFKSFKQTHKANDFWNLPPVYTPGIAQQLRDHYGFNWVALDKQGIYWAYLRTSINKPNSSLLSNNTHTGTIIKHPGLPDNYVGQSNIYNDPQDRLWIYYQDRANKNFIARMNKTTGTVSATYSIPDDVESPEPFVSQFYLDQQGVIWLTTINGLYAFNEIRNEWKHWKNIPGNSRSLGADGLLSICADPNTPEKFLWIGTEGAGLNRFNKQNGTCLRFDEKDGLPSNVAYCILADSLNNLWISTNRGLSCFNPAQRTFRNFTEEDGLPGNEFNRCSAMKLQNGELMFGGVDGFVIFNPKEILQKQPASPITFTNISIFNKPVNWKTDSANLNAPVGYANLLTLKPGQNIFSISFATLEYRNNAKKMYRYKLDGFDKDWTSPGSRNEVTYTNLSPGTYTFYVMGANTDGVWNEKPISMKIVVLPRWYQTFLFKVTLLSLFAAALYAFYRYRLKQGLKLEKLRNRIARDLHDEIGSNLSSISLYAASAKKITAGNEKAETILSKINIGTSEMMEAISDIVWAVNTGSDHFDELANRVRSFAVQVTEAKNIELRFTDNKDIPDITLNMEQRKNIYLICKEAINNAVKYSGCTLLEVLIRKENHQLRIHIHDNGKGFELSSLESPNNGHSFGGNGIKNMKNRAAEINSVLKLHTYPDAGASVELITPI